MNKCVLNSYVICKDRYELLYRFYSLEHKTALIEIECKKSMCMNNWSAEQNYLWFISASVGILFHKYLGKTRLMFTLGCYFVIQVPVIGHSLLIAKKDMYHIEECLDHSTASVCLEFGISEEVELSQMHKKNLMPTVRFL